MSNLTVTSYTSTGSTARSIDFTAGNIIVSNNSGGTLINMTATGLTVTGSSTGNGFTVTNTGATATTLTMPPTNEANAINLLVNAGSYALTLTGTSVVRNLNFTGFVGSVVNTAITIFLNLTLVAGMTAPAAGANAWTFGATTTQSLTSAGKTLDYPITQNGVGGTLLLNDALTMGSTRTFTLTNGTFELNGLSMSTGAFATAAGTKNLTFDGSTITITGSGTAWNNAAPAGFTTSAGTGLGTISLTNAAAKTFAGGGSTYAATLSHNGAGALTITGNNAFESITTPITATSAATLTLGSGQTQTVNTFGGTGQATRVLTINSSTSYSTATLYNNAGLTGFITGIDYISATDITFGPFSNDGADYIRWYVGANSTAFNNNRGAIFQAYTAGVSPKVYLIESSQYWQVPDDFDPSNNIIHMIGAGGGGARGSISNANSGGGGGGGGGYTKVNNYALAKSGQLVAMIVGAGGATTTSGGATTFSNYSAGGGGGGGLGSSWDRGAAGVGATFNGGQGGFGYSRLDYNNSGGGGGGAGGPLGNGGTGGNGSSDNANQASGGGGGGNGGGSNGTNGTNTNQGYPGAAGGNNAAGVGGGAAGGNGGTRGGGGAGSAPGISTVSRGSFGIDILNSFGSGGGSGGGGDSTVGVAGWGYGSGGSGSGSQTGSAAGGTGYQGVIIIQYVPITPTPPTPVQNSSLFLMFN